MLKALSTDSVDLINSSSETVADGSLRLVYFHPAADADAPGRHVGYIAWSKIANKAWMNPIYAGVQYRGLIG